MAVDTFEGNNLVLVDEGHRGAGGEEWMEKRARLCAKGFSFEYSATFGQAIKAASGAKQKALTQTYAKCILFDYSYKFFYNDGYGKDFNILNLAEEHEDETRPLYLTACLLSFYQQCRRFADGGAALIPYLLESPLMVFVGGSVTGQRQSQEDTDLVLILKFLASFISDRAESERRLTKLLATAGWVGSRWSAGFSTASFLMSKLCTNRRNPLSYFAIFSSTFSTLRAAGNCTSCACKGPKARSGCGSVRTNGSAW